METQNSSPLVLEQWRQAIQPFRNGSTRVTPSLVQKQASLLAAVLQNDGVSFGEILPELAVLPATVVGRAFGMSYSNLATDRRKQIWEWIRRQPHDRPDAERVYILPTLIRTGSESAFSCLTDMRTIPPPNKEQRERLASALSEFDTASIAALFRPGQKEPDVRKVVLLLLTAAEESRSDDRLRAAILEAVMPAVRKYRLHTGGSNYRQQIVSVFQRLPLELANRINQLLPENMQCTVTQVQMTPHVDDEIKEEQRPELPPDRSPAQDQKSESAKQVQPDEQAATVEFSKKMDVAPDPIAWFDANIQMLAHARQFYADARQQYEAERERRRELEGQLKAHAESEAALADSLTRLNQTRDSLNRLMETHDRIQKERDALVRDLQQERETRTSLENSLQALESSVKASGQEREQLSQRIDDHADKVLSDFRVALSSAISPLVKDLPDADSAQLAEFAPNLLIIIRQIIDTLADRGIEMHQAVGRPR